MPVFLVEERNDDLVLHRVFPIAQIQSAIALELNGHAGIFTALHQEDIGRVGQREHAAMRIGIGIEKLVQATRARVVKKRHNHRVGAEQIAEGAVQLSLAAALVLGAFVAGCRCVFFRCSSVCVVFGRCIVGRWAAIAFGLIRGRRGVFSLLGCPLILVGLRREHSLGYLHNCLNALAQCPRFLRLGKDRLGFEDGLHRSVAFLHLGSGHGIVERPRALGQSLVGQGSLGNAQGFRERLGVGLPGNRQIQQATISRIDSSLVTSIDADLAFFTHFGLVGHRAQSHSRRLVNRVQPRQLRGVNRCHIPGNNPLGIEQLPGIGGGKVRSGDIESLLWNRKLQHMSAPSLGGNQGHHLECGFRL